MTSSREERANCGSMSLDVFLTSSRHLPPLTAEDCVFAPSVKQWIPIQKLKYIKRDFAEEKRNDFRPVRVLVQDAPTGQSRCRHCGSMIEKGALRLGYPTADPRGAYGFVTCWLHPIPACCTRLLQQLLLTELKPTALQHLRSMLSDCCAEKAAHLLSGNQAHQQGSLQQKEKMGESSLKTPLVYDTVSEAPGAERSDDCVRDDVKAGGSLITLDSGENNSRILLLKEESYDNDYEKNETCTPSTVATERRECGSDVARSDTFTTISEASVPQSVAKNGKTDSDRNLFPPFNVIEEEYAALRKKEETAVVPGDSYLCKAHQVLGEALQLDLLCHDFNALQTHEQHQLRSVFGEAALWLVDAAQAAALKGQHDQQLREDLATDVADMMKHLVERKLEGRQATPPDLLLPLLPFQEEGLWWLCRQERSEVRGGILADEMGMGKTIQIIALVLARQLPSLPMGFSSKGGQKWSRVGQTLIVTPLAALLQWKGELERFVKPGRLSVLVYHGAFRGALRDALQTYDVVLTTYQTVEQDFRRETNKHKRLCRYCGRLYLPDKLVVHQRYFCGPSAERTAKQRLTARKKGTGKAMVTLQITSGTGDEVMTAAAPQKTAVAGHVSAEKEEKDSASSSSGGLKLESAEGVKTQRSGSSSRRRMKRANPMPHNDAAGENPAAAAAEKSEKSERHTAAVVEAEDSSVSSSSSFLPTPSNVMRELMKEANRDASEFGASWVLPNLRYRRRTITAAAAFHHANNSKNSRSVRSGNQNRDSGLEQKCSGSEKGVAAHMVGGSRKSRAVASASLGKTTRRAQKKSSKHKKLKVPIQSSSSSSSGSGREGAVERDVGCDDRSNENVQVAVAAAIDMGFDGERALHAALAAEGSIEETVRILVEDEGELLNNTNVCKVEEKEEASTEILQEEEDEEDRERRLRATEIRRRANLDKMDIPKQKVAVLQALLRRCGMPTSGTKQELVARLSRLLFPEDALVDQSCDRSTPCTTENGGSNRSSMAAASIVSNSCSSASTRKRNSLSGNGTHCSSASGQGGSRRRKGGMEPNWDNVKLTNGLKAPNVAFEKQAQDDEAVDKRHSKTAHIEDITQDKYISKPDTSSRGFSCKRSKSIQDVSSTDDEGDKREDYKKNKEMRKRKLKTKDVKKGKKMAKKFSRRNSSSSSLGGCVNAAVRSSPRLQLLLQEQQQKKQQNQHGQPVVQNGDGIVNNKDVGKKKKNKKENSREQKTLRKCRGREKSSFELDDIPSNSSSSEFTVESSEEDWTGSSSFSESSSDVSLCTSSSVEDASIDESEGDELSDTSQGDSSFIQRHRQKKPKPRVQRPQPQMPAVQEDEVGDFAGAVSESEIEGDAAMEKVVERSLLHSIVWQRLVLDEAHRIKSRSTSTAQAILALRTGTLICGADSEKASSSSNSAANHTGSISKSDTSSNIINRSTSNTARRGKSRTNVVGGEIDDNTAGCSSRRGTGYTDLSSTSGCTSSSSSSSSNSRLIESSKRKCNTKRSKRDDNKRENSGISSNVDGKRESTGGVVVSDFSAEKENLVLKKDEEVYSDEEELNLRGKDNEGVTWELKVGGSRWCLTGTPLQNRVGELFSLIKFLRVYPYAYYFCKKSGCNCHSLHYRFVEGRGCVKCGHTRMSHYSLFNQKVINPIKRCGYQNEGIVALKNLKRDVLDVVLLRRTKTERAADVKLPPLIVRIRRDELSAEERDFYESLFKQTAIQFDAYVESGTVLHNFAHIFDLLSRLRQAVDHPYLLVHGSLMPLDGISLLPTASRNDSDFSICALCQDDVEHVEHMVEASCGHSFHKACLSDYIASAPVDDGTKAGFLEGDQKHYAEDSRGKNPREVLGCPACYAPLSADLSVLQRQSECEGQEDALVVDAVSRSGLSMAKGDAGGMAERERRASLRVSGEKHRSTVINRGFKGAEDKEEELDEVLEEERHVQATGRDKSSGLSSVLGVESWLLHSGSKKATGIMSKIKASKFRSSTKIEALFQELQIVENENSSLKSLVFSQFCSMLDLIEWRLKKGGIRCAKLVGSMSVVSRSSVLYAFNNDPYLKVLLISLKAGGEGLNLQVASRIFLMDPWWNPAAEMQAIQRAHRIGQSNKEVIAIRFIAEKTIEERILQLQEKKQLVFDGTVGSCNQAMAKLTQEDLRFLFQN